MLDLIADFAVPMSLFMLMFIAGTEVTGSDLARTTRSPRAVLLGSAGQLLALPFIALIANAVTGVSPGIATATVLLALCPGGGISNCYCYLAQRNVLLSATITALGTLLSLITIPLWLTVLPVLPHSLVELPELPTQSILAQLFWVMVVPMLIGIGLRRFFPKQLESYGRLLRSTSNAIILLILVLAVWAVREHFATLYFEIGISAATLVLAAMFVGWLMGVGLERSDRAVLAIESGTRNIGVALILGRVLLNEEQFGVLATFLAGYFAVEVAIMLSYARLQAARDGEDVVPQSPQAN